MDKIQKNLSDIERKLTKSNALAAKGENMKLGDTIKLARKSNSIISTVKKGIKEYKDFTPTDDQSKQILEKMKTILGLTEKQLSLLVDNRAHFDKLHVGGLVKKNMNKSDQVGKELADVMLQKSPDSIKAEAEALDKRRSDAFKRATSAFENATGGEDQAEGEDDSD